MSRTLTLAVTRTTVIGGLLLALPALAHAQEDERARRVYDIFKTHCLECHGESRKGGLDLRTHETLLKGSASGRVVVPHDPQKSKLYLLVSHANPDEVMPPKKPKIPEEDVQAIAEWIEDGGSLEAVSDAVPDNRRSPGRWPGSRNGRSARPNGRCGRSRSPGVRPCRSSRRCPPTSARVTRSTPSSSRRCGRKV